MPTYTPLRRKIVHSLAVAGSPFTWQPPQGATEVDMMMVGGGGGGTDSGDGGGGGSIIMTKWSPVNGTTYTLTVGSGGAAATPGGETKINDGSNDIFRAIGGTTDATAAVPLFDPTIVQSLITAHAINGAAGGTSNSAGDRSEFSAGGTAPGTVSSGGGGSISPGGNGQAATGTASGGGGGFTAGANAPPAGVGGDGRIILTYRLGSGVTDNVPA